MIQNSTIFNDDFLNVIITLEDNSVDSIITDPPYGINFGNNSWDMSVDFMEPFISEANRCLKPTGTLILFTGWSSLSIILPKISPFILQNLICYDRVKGRGAKKNFVSTREEILFLSKTKNYTFNVLQSTIKKKTGGMGLKNGKECRTLSNVWSDIPPIVPWSKERVDHPTQKPLVLMERIVNVFTNKGDVVLDPFMGSGTTGVACMTLDRKFIGVELSQTYFDIAAIRINSTGINKRNDPSYIF